MTLLRRKPIIIQTTQQAAEEVSVTIKRAPSKSPSLDPPIVLSTGSTLLDLAISGGRIRGGGIPPGILVEIFGPSGAGKTALLAEIGASSQIQGGMVKFLDPEARLDQEYTRIYGLSLKESGNEYYRPDTVTDLVNHILSFEVPDSCPIGVVAADSIAALSTDMEMEKEDKMGMRRAKEFSEGLRKICRLISQDNKLVVFTNQVRQNLDAQMFGNKETTPGGMALPFYASLRLRIGFSASSKIKKETTKGKMKITKVIGINSEVYVVKSSVDEPYRTAPVSIVFGYGIDDIRVNIDYVKRLTGSTRYKVGESYFQALEEAVQYCEENQLQSQLREEVIDIWEAVERELKVDRMPKVRR